VIVLSDLIKVKSWKQQMRGTSPPDDEVTTSIFGKDDWKKKKSLARGSSVDEDSRQLQQQGNKMFAGVAGFPPVDSTEADAGHDDMSQLRPPTSTSDRDVSPYDNLRPPRHPDRQQRAVVGPRGKDFQSTDSLAGFSGDISASSDDESGIARTQSIKSADSWPRPRHAEIIGRGQVTSSLPDLVTSSETSRRQMNGSFIGGVRDIDSLLGFGETEDEVEVKSGVDDETSSSDNESEASFATSQERPQHNTEDSRHRPVAATPQLDESFIGEIEDIDEILGTDLVPSHLGCSAITEQSPTSPATTDNVFLRFVLLHIDTFYLRLFCR